MNSKSGWTRIGLVLAALLVGLCQPSLGQVGDAILEEPGLQPFPTPLASSAATLFQNVRIFDGKSAALSTPSNVLVRGNTPLNAYLLARSRSHSVVGAGVN